MSSLKTLNTEWSIKIKAIDVEAKKEKQDVQNS